MRKSIIGIASSLLILTLVGCGGANEQMQTAKVKGKVTFNGQPVVEGELLFAPDGGGDEPGKPGAAKIQPDGTFTVSTYGNGDGAVIGTHKITYIAPPPRQMNEQEDVSSGTPSNSTEKPVPSPFAGMVTEQQTVEVESGTNELEIKLVVKR